jgi:hypothetical protein
MYIRFILVIDHRYCTEILGETIPLDHAARAIIGQV